MRKDIWIVILTLSIGLFAARTEMGAASVTLVWDRNSEPDVAGYKVYYGQSSGVYPFVVDAGNATNHVIGSLEAGMTYYFAATAYNTAGVESDMSAEVSHAVPVPAISAIGDGSLLIHFRGVPGLTYRIQYAESLTTPVWRSLGNRTADPMGSFEIVDRPRAGAPTRFYRSVYP